MTLEDGDIGAADLMAGTPRQAHPEINPVVTVGEDPRIEESKISGPQRKEK